MTDRSEPPYTADEKTTLLAYLDYQRATLAWKCEGLDAEALARRAVAPSTLSLLGLVRHMADVERAWFSRLAGAAQPPLFSTDEHPDLDFDGAVPDEAVVTDAFAAWQAEIEVARRISEQTSFDATFFNAYRNAELSHRWVVVHMIEEYARHNGHADLLREAIDGRTGE